MMLTIFFDISTGFRFSKISVECSVHLCSCPWFRLIDEKSMALLIFLIDFCKVEYGDGSGGGTPLLPYLVQL